MVICETEIGVYRSDDWRTKSLPCVRGGGQNQLILTGGVVKASNPPVRNQGFLTAPFTQGGLEALPRQSDNL